MVNNLYCDIPRGTWRSTPYIRGGDYPQVDHQVTQTMLKLYIRTEDKHPCSKMLKAEAWLPPPLPQRKVFHQFCHMNTLKHHKCITYIAHMWHIYQCNNMCGKQM